MIDMLPGFYKFYERLVATPLAAFDFNERYFCVS